MKRGAQTFGAAYVRALEMQDSGAEIADVGPWLQRAKHELQGMQQELQDLIDRAVSESRSTTRRRSWTEIGRSLGVSRQAVQQKYDR